MASQWYILINQNYTRSGNTKIHDNIEQYPNPQA